MVNMMHFIKLFFAQGVSLKDIFGFSKFDTLGQFISAFLDPLFGLVGVLILFYFLYAGWKYLVSQGNKEELAKARAMITHAIIGAVILIVLFIVIQYLTQIFGAPE